MKITLTLLLTLIIFWNINSYSQEVAFYLKIDDPTLVPEKTKDYKSNKLVFKSNNTKMDDILKKYKFKKFHQAFPTSTRSSVRKLYTVVCDDKTFGDDIKREFKEEISGVYHLEGGLTYTPNDYGITLGQTNLDLINAKDAWDICREIPKISIGVSDTYFDLNHEDLNMTHFGGTNSPYVADNYHGTAVAGCIGAITDNNTGLASVGYDMELYVHNDYGSWGGDSAVLALAQAGHRVINCSWWCTCDSIPEIDSLYQEIREEYNAIVVFGAGNSNLNACGNNNPSYPAGYEVNVAVTSVGHIFDVGTTQSPRNNNWKDVHEEIIGDSLSAHKHHPIIDICAPGYNVSSTDIMGSGGLNGGNYHAFWGTSFAAPQVSGTLGLILSVNPCLSADDAVDILLSNTDDGIYDIAENQQYIGRLGAGRLDVFASVNAAAETATTYLDGITLSGTQYIEDNYAIRVINNVTLSSGANIGFITRKEVTIDKNFTVPLGATLTIDVDVNNTISCN
jgi:subtilisin family serine protease